MHQTPATAVVNTVPQAHDLQGAAHRVDLVAALGARGLANLEALVAHDSASDERSNTIPSTPGQLVLADWIAARLRALGADVVVDPHGNVVAELPGVGAAATSAPLAMMAHLDTARGTNALPQLQTLPRWQGQPVPYPNNPGLVVDVANYPGLDVFLGQTLVFGDGRAPFGLDDKLGLAEILTLADLLASDDAPRPPMIFVARPDEEIGNMAAVEGLSATLAARGVRLGWTIDGIAPFEINVENFHAAAARVTLPACRAAVAPTRARAALTLWIGGVNTHGATAKAESHRPATRLAVEIRAALAAAGLGGDQVAVIGFESDAERDCDGILRLAVGSDAPADAEARIEAAAHQVLAPHLPRGASLRIERGGPPVDPGARGEIGLALDLCAAILACPDVQPVAAEDSEGRQGYSQPYRILEVEGGVRLDVRIRDFDTAALDARGAIVERLAPSGATVERFGQYVNMGPALADVAELVTWPQRAGAQVGVASTIQPIRGGTGVDPFLVRGVFIGNLGTGYFAPESEKELTTVETIGRHVVWLWALVRNAAAPATAE